MPRYEYKVVPAPTKGQKAKGVRGAEARFSHAVQELMNGLSGYGWEYLRAETLPQIERSGLGAASTEWRHVLVFRRPRADDASAFEPELLPSPDPVVPAPLEKGTNIVAEDIEEEEEYGAAGRPGALHMFNDNGVEETSEVAGMTNSLARLAQARKNAQQDPESKEET